jgi:hypothetical protein
MVRINHRMTTGIKELKQYLHEIYSDKSVSYKSSILGIILFTLGILVFLIPLGLDNKIGLSLLFTGFFIVLFITENNISTAFDRFFILIIILWVWIVFFITDSVSVDIFIFLLLLGILISLELTAKFLTSSLKKRLILMSGILCIVYVLFLAEKVISYLNI